ncbi:alpha/beta hydrolase [Rhodococcus sp. HNM0569]|uniref:alpha/beta hydrolase n=1 Tax=Rhodococcus sp. HNM0569 TaxID=2716340 RepID=UPI00146C9E70|nr:alpha/beta hydrolase [Rhodococcus sp. HNM0569]NLU82851.1 alpha/beta hydrolase [Rhodococcus sp. HNM0569]
MRIVDGGRARSIAVVAVLAACGLTAACAPPEPGRAEPEQGAASEGAPAALERFYTQTLDWGPCDSYDTDGTLAGTSLECARVDVPVDYDDPAGASAEIAISRSAASGDRLGSLLVNPGGPGASGLSLASVADGTEIGARFDVVGFDPRGVGASTPAIECLTDRENDERRARSEIDMSPDGIAETEKHRREYAQACAERTGSDVLAHVGTRDVVQDMDVIRAVLGDTRLNYLGYSYGTRLGSAYAEQFPDRVRAMILDGAVDPGQDPVDEVVEQAAGFQQAFDAFAADCMRTSACPLGDDPAQANARFQQLVEPLVTRPAATTDPRGLGYGDAITGVQQALYSPTLWGPLRGGLTSLARGTGDALLSLADLYEGRADDGTYSNINDAFNAVRCVDDPPVTDRAVAGESDMRYREAAPFLDDGRGTGQAPLDVCAFWSVPPTGEPHEIAVDGLPPVMVVSTTGDPATPYQAGVDLARQLGGTLLTYDGTQHTVVLDGVACVDEAAARYLEDPAASPPELRC